MNEVTKLYENAKVEQKRMCEWTCKDSETCNLNCEHYGSMQLYYPPFTAEKQIKLIKFMLHKGIYYDTDGDTYWFHYTDEIENATYRPFEEAIAEFINGFWQDLTDAEHTQIKEILE